MMLALQFLDIGLFLAVVPTAVLLHRRKGLALWKTYTISSGAYVLYSVTVPHILPVMPTLYLVAWCCLLVRGLFDMAATCREAWPVFEPLVVIVVIPALFLRLGGTLAARRHAAKEGHL
ncbi:MAG: hypothetical protein ACYCWW_02495 [Deltaproteobacteria bacterium]